MKVFLQGESETFAWEIETLDTKNSYLRQYGHVYDVPGKLVRQHKKLSQKLEVLYSELALIHDSQEGEESPFKTPPQRPYSPAPLITTYQLIHVRSGSLMIELTTPKGAEWGWEPDPGRAPEGVMQWYCRHSDEPGFNKLGDEFRFIEEVVPVAEANPYAVAQARWLAREYPDWGIKVDDVAAITFMYERSASSETWNDAVTFKIDYTDGTSITREPDDMETPVPMTRMIVEGLALMESTRVIVEELMERESEGDLQVQADLAKSAARLAYVNKCLSVGEGNGQRLDTAIDVLEEVLLDLKRRIP